MIIVKEFEDLVGKGMNGVNGKMKWDLDDENDEDSVFGVFVKKKVKNGVKVCYINGLNLIFY